MTPQNRPYLENSHGVSPLSAHLQRIAAPSDNALTLTEMLYDGWPMVSARVAWLTTPTISDDRMTRPRAPSERDERSKVVAYAEARRIGSAHPGLRRRTTFAHSDLCHVCGEPVCDADAHAGHCP